MVPFIAFLSAFIIAMIFAIVRWRVFKLKKDRARLEAEVRNRTRTIAAQVKN
ncbi:MAG: hypothetical protein H6573_15460 [Lewinellaceae bacterium]|nr:hypothetical protein [Lewinellaceae bacterium]